MKKRILLVATLVAFAISAEATIQNINGFLLYSAPDYGGFNNGITINAVGESHGIVGMLRIANGATSKTISAAGSGKILWKPEGVTWASSGSTVRVGIQDVSTSTGLEDGTFDVYKEYVQGTDTISATTYTVATMSSGTKTISNGDIIAIVVEMTVRNGTDSVQVSSTLVGGTQSNGAFGFPYGTSDTGTLAKSTTQAAYAVIQFDDGTVGWILGVPVIRIPEAGAGVVSDTINTGTTPDEVVGAFTPNIKMQICGIGAAISSLGTTDNTEVILYTDPLGTPSATITVTVDPDIVANSATSGIHFFKTAPTILSAGTTYGVAVRPTTANNIVIREYDLGSSTAGDIVRAALPIPSLKVGTRINQTGAFSDKGAQYLPEFAIDVCGIDDGTGTGSEHAYPFAMLRKPR